MSANLNAVGRGDAERARAPLSVVIPCYNAAAYIGRTVTSILAQEPAPSEIIVVDDGSTDGSVAALEPFGDSVRCVEIANSGGPSRPRNIGVQEANQHLVAFCDADDVMLPGKIAAVMEAFGQHPGIDLLFTNFQICDEQERILVPDFLARYRDFRSGLEPTGHARLALMPGAAAFRCLLRANFIGTSSVVCRAEAFVAAGGFDESMPNSEDVDLWRRMALAGQMFGYLDVLGHWYRYHASSLSQGGARVFPAIIAGLEKWVGRCEEAADEEALAKRIHDTRLAYGYALNAEGRDAEARAVYCATVSERLDWRGLRGWLLTWVPRWMRAGSGGTSA